jgi:hypothetical protein
MTGTKNKFAGVLLLSPTAPAVRRLPSRGNLKIVGLNLNFVKTMKCEAKVIVRFSFGQS